MTSHPRCTGEGAGPRGAETSPRERGVAGTPAVPMGPRPTHGGRKRFGCLETVIFLSLQFFSYTAKA